MEKKIVARPKHSIAEVVEPEEEEGIGLYDNRRFKSQCKKL